MTLIWLLAVPSTSSLLERRSRLWRTMVRTIRSYVGRRPTIGLASIDNGSIRSIQHHIVMHGVVLAHGVLLSVHRVVVPLIETCQGRGRPVSRFVRLRNRVFSFTLWLLGGCL